MSRQMTSMSTPCARWKKHWRICRLRCRDQS
jgi:hypothetical protein